MQNPFGLLLLIVFGGAGLISLFTVIGLLLPVPVERTRAILESSLGRSLLLGVINFLFVAMIDALFIWLAQVLSIKVISGILILLAGLLTLALALLTLLGIASLANFLGRRMDKGNNEFNANLRGGALLFLAGLTPYLGWFVFTPLVLWTAFGAAIQTVFRRKEKMA